MLSVDSLEIYLPIDRRHALAGGEDIPDRVHGAALFADISGFTPLTAALTEELGRQRGAEEVLHYINPLYEAIIKQLHAYRGSVISFAGDAITCWIDDDDGRCAVACALAMQEIMGRFSTLTTPGGTQVSLSIKIGLAVGPARRFLVGDPQIHTFDVLAGATLERMSAAGDLAEKGEIVVSREIFETLGDGLQVEIWNPAEGSDQAFAVVDKLTLLVARDPWPAIPPATLQMEQLKPWVEAPVYERLQSGTTFLAEMRPATMLFLDYTGIDYDGDPQAGDKLDNFIRQVQSVLLRYEGYLSVLSFGDKGSYLLATFGAPVAHDDDECRAVAAALDLRMLPDDLKTIQDVQIGISQGVVWTGAIGGNTRCIYTVIGDDVNVAARLMSAAAPGQILVSRRVAQQTQDLYRCLDLGHVQVKGKTGPIQIEEVLNKRSGVGQELLRLFASPLVGREDVLEELNGYLARAYSGKGQVLRLEGPAGIGKSHLAAVFALQADEQGWQIAQGASESTEQDVPYRPWRQIFTALLGLDTVPQDERIGHLTAVLNDINPDWEPRLALMGDLLGFFIPDTAMTQNLDPNQRRQALFALMAEILHMWSKRQPLLLVLEDIHWMDHTSAMLTVATARAIRNDPILLLIVQRPSLGADQQMALEMDHLAYYHKLVLGDLSPEGVSNLVRNRMGKPLTSMALDLVVNRTQGNPFFAEELVDALSEAGYLIETETVWDLSESTFDALLSAGCLKKMDGEWVMVENPPLGAAKLDIPDSVHSTVLARMDRLPEPHKLTLKTASVIGRTFGLDLLHAIHPRVLATETLQGQIESMLQRDFVRLEWPGEAPVYIFKHNTTQEVAYSTLLFAQRRLLHSQVAEWYEAHYTNKAIGELDLEAPLAPYYPQMVYHWHNADNPERERLYAGLAGEQAAQRYANESAVRFYSRAIELAPQEYEEIRYKLLLGREAGNDVLGRRSEQAEDLAALKHLAENLGDVSRIAKVYLRRARYADLTDDRPTALDYVQEAIPNAIQAQDRNLESQAYHAWGRILWKQSEYLQAREQLQVALRLAQETGDRLHVGRCYYDIGMVYQEQAKYTEARKHYQRALAIYRELDYRLGEIECMQMLGVIDYQAGDYPAAEGYFEKALALSRTIGSRLAEMYILNYLANNYFDMGDYQAARSYHQQVLAIAQEIANRDIQAASMDTLCLVYYITNEHENAVSLARQALAIERKIGDRFLEGYTLNHLGLALAEGGDLTGAREAFQKALAVRRDLGQAAMALDDLAGLARAAQAERDMQKALLYVEEILSGIVDHGTDGIEFPVLVYLTCFKLLEAAGNLNKAMTALQDGYDLLQERAGRIKDEGLRKGYLENVPFNRELQEEWEKVR